MILYRNKKREGTKQSNIIGAEMREDTYKRERKCILQKII